MKILIVLSSIVLPALMFLIQRRVERSRFLFNALALLAALMFGNIAALSIHQIIVDDAVFMTTIHGIFLDPLFIIAGAYLGLYLIYRLLILAENGR